MGIDDSVVTQAQMTEMDGKYLTFFIEEQLFGIAIADVVQIVGIQNITPVPDFPSYAKGIINLRGTVIPVIDMRIRLGKCEAEYNERTCIIVTNINEHYIGFIVDAVDEVADIDEKSVSPCPHMAHQVEQGYLVGIARLDKVRVALLLDAAKILNENVVEMLMTEAA